MLRLTHHSYRVCVAAATVKRAIHTTHIQLSPTAPTIVPTTTTNPEILTPTEAHRLVESVYHSKHSATQAPVAPLPTPVQSSSSSSHLLLNDRDPRLRVRTPYYPPSRRVDWEFFPYAEKNDFEGVFQYLEQREREVLQEGERAWFVERQKLRAEAEAKGEVLPLVEDEMEWKELSKKAQRRRKQKITSTSPSLVILGRIPRSLYIDLFQTFATKGRLDGLDYIIRRMEQLDLRVDEQVTEIWMSAVVIACTEERRILTAKKLGAQSTAEQIVSDAQQLGEPEQQKIEASMEVNPTPTSSEKENPESMVEEKVEEKSADSKEVLSTDQTETTTNNALANPYTHSVGLPTSGIARHHILRILQMLVRHRIQPSFQFVRTAFEAYALDNDVHGGLAFIAKIYNMKYYVSGFTYALLISALAKHQHSRGCMFVFLHMEKARFSPHPQTFNALIQSFASVGDYQTAYRLMQDMQASNLQPDTHTFAALLEACCRAGKFDLALEMMDYLRKNQAKLTTQKQIRISPGSTPASIATGSSPSSSASSAAAATINRQLERAEQRQQKNIKLLPANLRPQTTTQTVPLRLGPQPYSILIAEWLKRGELKQAIDLMNEQVRGGVKPLLRSYHMLFNACERPPPPLTTKKNEESQTSEGSSGSASSSSMPSMPTERPPMRRTEAKALWQQLHAMGVLPKTVTYNAYLPLSANWKEAKELYLQMRRGKVESTSQSTETEEEDPTTILSSRAAAHRPLQPDASTFRVLLRLLLQESQTNPQLALDEFVWLWTELRTQRLLADGPFIATMVRLIRQAGREGPAEILKLTHAKLGLPPLDEAFMRRICSGTKEELEQDWQRLRDAVNDNEEQGSTVRPSATWRASSSSSPSSASSSRSFSTAWPGSMSGVSGSSVGRGAQARMFRTSSSSSQHQHQQDRQYDRRSNFVYLAGLGSFVLLGGVLATRAGALDTVQAAEGDSAKTNIELDLPDTPPEGLESECFKYNDAGEIEWMSTSTRPRIVVLGTGWGSVSFLKHLDINRYEIVVISPRNYFLFTPLLPSACTGTLEMGSLTEPIRQILLHRHQTNANQYVEAKAVRLDREQRKVQCVDGNGRSFVVQYDHLIIGVGANNNTFNTPGVKDFAFFLKEAKHARIIRKNILEHFERASSPTTSLAEKEALLQFVIVGGGPTGVEFAGELVDFLDSDLKAQFPSLIPFVRVRLLQSQEHILNTYDEAISRYAEEKFKELRIEVITGARVKAISEGQLSYEDKLTKQLKVVPFGICLWSTGIEMNDFTRSVSSSIKGQQSDKALVTDEYLRLLKEIPHLDRVPKRIVVEAAKVIAPGGAVPASSGASTSSASPPATTPAPTPAAAPDSPADDIARDLDVDNRVYAIGDCATTYIPKLSKRMKRIFAAADVNGDGKLSYDELRNLCATLSQTFPVLSAQMAMILAQHTRYTIADDVTIDLEDFKKMLEDADKNVRVYPATAQVAAQQGKYLARRFNRWAEGQIKAGKMQDLGGRDHWQLQQKLVKEGVYHRLQHEPIIPADPKNPKDPALRAFQYKHLGSLAYIGGESAAIDLGKGGAYYGKSAFWLWKSAYLSEAVSTRTRLNLAWDWCKTWFFGRDTSKP